MGELLLYDHPASPCARRVRVVLLEKGLAWKSHVLDLTRMEQKSAWYLALNPNGIVPTLVDGDRVIYESNVITEYLDDVHPGPKLYPADPWQRAQAKMWQAFELEMAKEFRPLMYHRVIGPVDRGRSKEELLADVRKSTTDAAQIAWVQKVYDGAVIDDAEAKRLDALLLGRLDRLDAHLADRAFLVGDRFTIADVSVLPRVAMYPWIQLPIDAARHPNVRRWLDANERRESFVRSVSAPA
jgi:glutathione S-transferase